MIKQCLTKECPIKFCRMNEWMTTNEWMVKYVSIYQNAKHGQTIKKLNKWIRCAALQKEKYNTGFFKSYFSLPRWLC